MDEKKQGQSVAHVITDNDPNLISFYKFKIKLSEITYYYMDYEDPIRSFGDLIEKCDDTPLSWDEVKTETKINCWEKFEGSEHRAWCDSWLLLDDELKTMKIMVTAEEMKSVSTEQVDEDFFYAWLYQIDSGSKYCLYEGDLFCQSDSDLYGQGLVGVFIGYFDDICSPPIFSNYNSDTLAVTRKLFAYFTVLDNYTKNRRSFLDEVKKIDSEISEKKQNDEADYLLGIYSGLKTAGDIDSLENVEHIENKVLNRLPRYKRYIDHGYRVREVIGLDFIMDEVGVCYFPHWPKKLDSGEVEIHIDTKTAAKIICRIVDSKCNQKKVRNLYHAGVLQGEKRTSIMVKMQSIFDYVSDRVGVRVLTSLVLYGLIRENNMT